MDSLVSSLREGLGPLVMGALEDDSILEIMLNPDGRLWVERFGHPMQAIGTVDSARATAALRLVATYCKKVITDKEPSVQGVLPFGLARFQGMIPPIVSGPTFDIRKRAIQIFTLEDYVVSGILSSAFWGILRSAILSRKNIVVVGGTGSGKTTFVNGLIHELSLLSPDHRLVIMEDTPELQSASENVVFLLSTDDVPFLGLVKMTLRLRPDRILAGEVRDGVALDMLKSWNTGHPGGIATYHATSAEEALPRLEELVAEATPAPKQALIGRAIDLVVYIEKTPQGRRVSQLLEVSKWDKTTQEYITQEFLCAS